MSDFEQKFNEIESELITIIDIVELLGLLCDCEYVDNYKLKLYLLTNLLKEKCVQLNDMQYELKAIIA